jgi:hypothetical protein
VITNSVSVEGTIAPGASTGIIHTGNLSIAATGIYLAEVDFNNDLTLQPDADQIDVTGSVTLASGATLQFEFIDVPSPAGAVNPSRTVVLVRNDGGDAVSGTFTTLPPNGAFGGLIAYTIDHAYDADTQTPGGGNDVAVTFTFVPEPASGLLLVPLLAAGMRRRRK